MAKSLKSRLDDAYRVVIDPTRCPTCGKLKAMIMELYINDPADPVGTKKVPYPCDSPRCPTCNKPAEFLIYESERRVKLKLEDDRATRAKSIQDDLS